MVETLKQKLKLGFALTLIGVSTLREVQAAEQYPPVTVPPESFFLSVRDRDRDTARHFYTKYIDVKGMPVVASAVVSDDALRRTYEIVTHMLAGRPDVLNTMATNGTRLIVIGKDQLYTDMPEYRNSRNPDYLNERVRGTGGFGVTSFGEENLLNLPIDRYDDESIGAHEFCHTIDAALGRIDPTWRRRLRQTFTNSISKGLWKNTYAGSNAGEYWAELVTMYFDCERPNNWNHGPISTREELKLYDPEVYAFIKKTFNLTPAQDWHYKPLLIQPSVICPPASFKFDPYYTKFTFAREFPVLGSSKVSDAALLKANDTIRKMFAYRHDILKAMIADGDRLVVLGRDEKLSELPEFRTAKDSLDFDETRYFEYTPKLKLMVVPEENVLAQPKEPFAGECMVVNLFAKALYQVTGLRPADTNWNNRGYAVQQYEMRVKRMDVEFDQKLGSLYDQAMQSGHWKGTTAAQERGAYWAAGVEAYFDASGESQAPNDAERPITTREALKAYDPPLYGLVAETMAYDGHVDWRYRR